jgi:hypothetical protein
MDAAVAAGCVLEDDPNTTRGKLGARATARPRPTPDATATGVRVAGGPRSRLRDRWRARDEQGGTSCSPVGAIARARITRPRPGALVTDRALARRASHGIVGAVARSRWPIRRRDPDWRHRV